MGNICMNADPGPPTSDDMDGSKHSKDGGRYLPASPLTPQLPVHAMDLEAAINHLNKLDRQRRMKDGREIYLNKQSHARRDGDACPDPFFSAVADDAAFWRLPTVEAFIALLDNYTRSVGRADRVTAEARHEQTTFLAALAATPHLEFALKYIRAHARDERAKRVATMPELMKLLKDIWSLRRCGNR